MVKTFALSAAFVGASLVAIVQAATLKQSPLFGCVSMVNGTLGLGSPDDDTVAPANFVAGLTMKSSVSGETRLSQLATHSRTGAQVTAGNFEFLNCTQSLIDRGYKLYVPQNFQDLNDTDGNYTFSWGVLRNQAANLHSLATSSLASSAGSIDKTPLVSSTVSKTSIKARTFIMASTDDGAISYLEWYPFAGKKTKAKSGIVYRADNRYGSVLVSTKHTAHSGSTYLALTSATD